jgi:hypothetical protein
LIDKETNFDWEGGGTEGGYLIFLDRQNVNCDKNALNSFKWVRELSRPDDPDSFTGKARYEFKCNADYKSTSGTQMFTPHHEDGGSKDIVYLDRQSVQCGDKPLKQFHLRRATDEEGTWNRVYYAYTCGNKKIDKDSCRATNTEWVPEGDHRLKELSAMNVACEPDEVLTGFRLKRETTLDEGITGNMRYDYTCCKPK